MNVLDVFKKHKQWPAVKEVCGVLAAQGFQALLAGGCVRDGLLGRAPQDFDVATNALPEQVEAAFAKTVAVGKQFGVMMVIAEGQPIEVATFRQDGPYKDGRHPTEVKFSSAREDAFRRDFTVNGMFYDLNQDKVIDYVGGLSDLQQRSLQTVGDPRLRFAEDKLRMMRACRFACQLNFQMQPATYLTVKAMANEVTAVSRERLQAELVKILQSPNRVVGLTFLFETKLLPHVLPSLDLPFKAEFYWLKAKLALENLGNEQRLDLLLAAVYVFQVGHWQQQGLDWQTGVRQVVSDLKALKFSREIQSGVEFVLAKMPSMRSENTPLAQKLRWLAEPSGLSLVDLCSQYDEVEGCSRESLTKLIEHYVEICDHQGDLPKPWINGEDLLRLGIVAGPKMGELLRQAYDLQLEGQLTSRKLALDWIQSNKLN